MKVRFRTNLGTADAARMGISNAMECLYENVVEVPDKAAKALAEAGIAIVVELPNPAPVELESVPAAKSESELAADPVKKKK